MQSFITPLLPTPRRVRQRVRSTICSVNPRPNFPYAKHEPSSAELPPIFFVLGGPGSGKGTQCQLLKQDFDFAQICVGDLLRREAQRDTDLGRSVADIMQRGEIVPGEVTMELLKDELGSLKGLCEGVLIDGFPRAMDQALAFEELVATCSFVLFFKCKEEEMYTRLLKRGETSGRADDIEEVIMKRMKTFIDKTIPVVEHYRDKGVLKEIDSGTGSVAEVYNRTKKIFTAAFCR